MRAFYTIVSGMKLKKASLRGSRYKDFFQAGKSVETIDDVASVADIMNELRDGDTTSQKPGNVIR